MNDNKKVIDGQKEVIMHLLRMSEKCSENYEPYYDKLRNYAINTWALLENLLKEQEPIEPIWSSNPEHIPTKCAKCNNRLDTQMWQYCPYCGRKVKWDE